jgi:hypothetical protein
MTVNGQTARMVRGEADRAIVMRKAVLMVMKRFRGKRQQKKKQEQRREAPVCGSPMSGLFQHDASIRVSADYEPPTFAMSMFGRGAAIPPVHERASASFITCRGLMPS